MAPVFTNDGAAPLIYGTQYIPVFFNGALIGRVYRDDATTFCNQLRMWKLENGPIPACTEIVFIHPEEQTGGPSPAVYLSTDASRLQREVRHLGTGKTELIGAMEQVYLEIACVEEDIRKGETTHIECSPANMLSLIASLTPFSDFNQSPRNMYQCQVVSMKCVESRWESRRWARRVCRGSIARITSRTASRRLRRPLCTTSYTATTSSTCIRRE